MAGAGFGAGLRAFLGASVEEIGVGEFGCLRSGSVSSQLYSPGKSGGAPGRIYKLHYLSVSPPWNVWVIPESFRGVL